MFGEVSEVGQGSSEHFERGNKLLIRDGATIKRSTAKRTNTETTGGEEPAFGSGMQGGKGTKKSQGGNNIDPQGAKPITGSGVEGNAATE